MEIDVVTFPHCRKCANFCCLWIQQLYQVNLAIPAAKVDT